MTHSEIILIAICVLLNVGCYYYDLFYLYGVINEDSDE